MGKLWENAEKARVESEASMAKDAEEKKKIDDVVQNVLKDVIPKKTSLEKKGAEDKDSEKSTKEASKSTKKEVKKAKTEDPEDEEPSEE